MNKNVLPTQPSFGELLARYMSQKNCSDAELAKEINVLIKDIANDIKITGIKEPVDIIDQWLNDQLYTLRGKYVSRLKRFFRLTDEQSDEFLLVSDCLQNFGKLLEFYMGEKGLNSNRLAKKIGVQPITVGRWIKETVANPRPDSVKEMASVLGILKLPPTQIAGFFLLAGCTPPPNANGVGVIGTDIMARNISIEKVSQDEIPPKPITPTPIPGIPIFHPNQFFGRMDILKRFKWAWQQPTALQHVAIIGKRRSGKTSLLKYLQYINQTPATELRPEQPHGWNSWLPNDFQFVFIDFQYAAMSKPESLLTHILHKLHLPIPTSCDLINFTKVLDEQLTKPTVMLFDEIGAGLQSADLDRVFWSNMRALGNNCANGKLGFVVTAHEPIQTLAQDNAKESPFFNIFGHTMYLKPLNEAEATGLINSFFRPLPTADIDWILQNSGGWPALLQLLCDSRLRTLEEGDDSDAWKTEGLERIEPFLGLVKIE